jgi:Flp pilus assembly protein TadD
MRLFSRPESKNIGGRNRLEQALAALRLGILGALGLYSLGFFSVQGLFWFYGVLLGLPGAHQPDGALRTWAWFAALLLPLLALAYWLLTQDVRNREHLTRSWDSWRWFDEGVDLLGTEQEFGSQQEECFARSAVLDPGDPFARNNLGAVLSHQGRHAEAAAEYRRAIRENPDYWKAWSNLGAALAGSGDIRTAAGCYRKALKLNPRDPATHLNLGIALLRMGRNTQARAHLREFLVLDPAHPRREEITRWLQRMD